MVAAGGDPSATTSVTVTQAVSVASQTGSAAARAVLPLGVEISLAGGGTFDTANLIAADVSTGTTVTGYDVVRGATSFGSGSASFHFSKPIKIEIPSPGAANGPIAVRVNHGTGFVTTGLTNSPDASCADGVASPASSTATVVGSVATIYTCSASTFAAVDLPNTQNTDNNNSSSGGGGGGGGSGGAASRKDTCPNGDYSPSYYDSKCGVAPAQDDILDSNTDLSDTTTNISEAVTTAVELVGTIRLQPTTLADGSRRFVLTSGRGEIVLKTNTRAELSLTIPGDTVVTSSSGWDGSLQAPVQISSSASSDRGLVVLFAGNRSTGLSFSQPIAFTVPVAYENGTAVDIYTSTGADASVTLHARATVVSGRVKFTTDHLSYFILRPSGAAAEPAAASFPDIADSFAREYIEQLYSMGVVN